MQLGLIACWEYSPALHVLWQGFPLAHVVTEVFFGVKLFAADGALVIPLSNHTNECQPISDTGCCPPYHIHFRQVIFLVTVDSRVHRFVETAGE